MKLKPITPPDPTERQGVSLHRSSLQCLQTYRNYYRSCHGTEITLSQLIEEIVIRFLSSDRGFQRYLKANPHSQA